MSFLRIASADDPRVADYRAVAEPELARERGLFVAEGRLVVQRVIDAGPTRIISLLVDEAGRRALETSLARLPAVTPVYVCDTALLTAIAGFNIHRGCLALAERPVSGTVDGLLRKSRLLVALENVANADNIGGVFRNAAAFGADAVILSPSCGDPLYRKAIRTSMGAALSVPF